MKPKQTAGTLYVVATPIGNLDDISQRAIRILAEVDLIASEDTRHTGRLLRHLGIRTPLTSYYREKEHHKAELLLPRLLAGEDIALVSDAGTPGISDPGAVLVGMARENDITVVPVPGPSALTAALSAAGLREGAFYFGGFPPARQEARKKFLTPLAALPCTLVFYESPHRIRKCLADCLEIFGDRPALLFRELTKMHEECLQGTLSQLLAGTRERVRGELVLVIHGAPAATRDQPAELDDLIRWYRDQAGSSLKDAVRRISSDLAISRSRLYRRALAIWNDKPPESSPDDGA
ncbi:MAG TPA: 16S rRNA (cytidine(1402)-2'-O)-methyltransferase [Desulfobulbus sp.]|nr:16S rRNA (cytidine(1402)-2'-O)-methyltransferase [Desulfobulbus sp.]